MNDAELEIALIEKVREQCGDETLAAWNKFYERVDRTVPCEAHGMSGGRWRRCAFPNGHHELADGITETCCFGDGDDPVHAGIGHDLSMPFPSLSPNSPPMSVDDVARIFEERRRGFADFNVSADRAVADAHRGGASLRVIARRLGLSPETVRQMDRRGSLSSEASKE